jgi:hypothetical protein
MQSIYFNDKEFVFTDAYIDFLSNILDTPYLPTFGHIFEKVDYSKL